MIESTILSLYGKMRVKENQNILGSFSLESMHNPKFLY